MKRSPGCGPPWTRRPSRATLGLGASAAGIPGSLPEMKDHGRPGGRRTTRPGPGLAGAQEVLDSVHRTYAGRPVAE